MIPININFNNHQLFKCTVEFRTTISMQGYRLSYAKLCRSDRYAEEIVIMASDYSLNLRVGQWSYWVVYGK